MVEQKLSFKDLGLEIVDMRHDQPTFTEGRDTYVGPTQYKMTISTPTGDSMTDINLDSDNYHKLMSFARGE